MKREAITPVELICIWSISIVVFGSVGYFSISVAERFFTVLYPLLGM